MGVNPRDMGSRCPPRFWDGVLVSPSNIIISYNEKEHEMRTLSKEVTHRPGSRIFPFFSRIFRIFTMLIKCRIWPFPHKKNHYFRNENSFTTSFFTLFILSRASDNTTSQNIGGTDTWSVPHLKLLGETVPPVPLGLCPWAHCCWGAHNPRP